MPEQNDITSNLDLLLQTLPQHLRDSLATTTESRDALLEIVMDLGRLPEARYRHTSVFLGNQEITFTDLETVTGAISAFGEDNRAGIPRT
jgi:stage III sporulation protein SpoIIIAA